MAGLAESIPIFTGINNRRPGRLTTLGAYSKRHMKNHEAVGKSLSTLLMESLHDVRHLLKLLRKKTDEQAVHRLRLVIKRLRVILAVLRQMDEGRKKTHRLHRSLRNLFLCAGQLRDVQVVVGLIASKPWGDVPLQIMDVEGSLKKADRKFRDCIAAQHGNAFRASKSLQKWLAIHPSEEVRQATIQLRDKYFHVIEQKPSEHDEDSIHDTRTALKRMVELDKICSMLGYNILNANEVQGAKALAKDIGDWHDLQMMTQYLQSNIGHAPTHQLQHAIRKSLVLLKQQQVDTCQVLGKDIQEWVIKVRSSFLPAS